MGFTNKDEPHEHKADYEGDMFTGITTYHGLVRIYNSKQWFGRIFWITVVIVAYTVFVLQAYNLLLAYHQKPTNYKSNIISPENGIQFPAVVICNYSPVKQRKVNISYPNLTRHLQTYIMSSFLPVENFESFVRFKENLIQLDAELSQYNLQLDGSKEFRFERYFNDTAYDCEDLFVSCSFGGFKFDCCKYARPIMTDVGVCFDFLEFGEGGPTSWYNRQFVSGESYGLQLILNAQTDQYPKGVFPSMEKGIRFFVHRAEEAPHLSAKGIAIPPGFKGSAALSVTDWKLLDEDNWGHCQKTWKSMDRPISYTYYTLANCEANCMADYYRKRCNCVPMKYYVHAPDMKVCSPKRQFECFVKSNSTGIIGDITLTTNDSHSLNIAEYGAYRASALNSSAYWYQCAGNKCGVECDKTEYEILMSYANLEPDLLAKSILDIPDPKYAKRTILHHSRENYILLNTYLRDISYREHIQQKALDPTTILSNIGGNTGMFLGMSVITLAEIFVFFTKCIWAYCDPKRRAELHGKLREERGIVNGEYVDNESVNRTAGSETGAGATVASPSSYRSRSSSSRPQLHKSWSLAQTRCSSGENELETLRLAG